MTGYFRIYRVTQPGFDNQACITAKAVTLPLLTL